MYLFISGNPMDSNFKEMRVGGHHGALIILLCSFGLKQCGNTKITITNFLPDLVSHSNKKKINKTLIKNIFL